MKYFSDSLKQLPKNLIYLKLDLNSNSLGKDPKNLKLLGSALQSLSSKKYFQQLDLNLFDKANKFGSQEIDTFSKEYLKALPSYTIVGQ